LADDELKLRMNAVERLTVLLRLDRMMHLGVTRLSRAAADE
jgi:hypothetical protein